MAGMTTLARPYAKAVFSVARFSGLLLEWGKVLQFLAAVVSNEQALQLLKDQTVSATDKADFLIGVGADRLQARGQNLIKILAYNRRLLVLPEISRVFDLLCKEAENKVELKVVTAQKLAKPQVDKLQGAFSKYLAGVVSIQAEVDASLLGGVMVKFGDRVIDASVRGQLLALHTSLRQ
jgi:F-type H+-transporting ATPase subunit delta